MKRITLVTTVLIALLIYGCAKKENTVKIGVVLSLSGDVAPYGKRALNGINLAVEEINAQGGILGRKVEIDVQDCKSNPKDAVNAVNTLINIKHVKYIIGALMSSNTLAIAPICEKNKVILISPGSSNPDISYAGDYIFRNWPSDILEGVAMALFSRKNLSLQDIAVISIQNDYGRGLTETYTKYFQKLGGKIKCVEYYDQNTDLRTLAQKVVSLRPQGIYLPGHGDKIGILVKRIREIDKAKKITLYSAVGAESPDVYRIAGAAVDGLIFSSPAFGMQKNDVYEKFVESYKDKYGEEPEIFAATAYDAVYIIKLAIEKANSFSTEKVKDALYDVKFAGASGVNIFDSNGDVIKSVAIKRYDKTGKTTVLTVINPDEIFSLLRQGEKE